MKRKIVIESIWLASLLILSELIYAFVPGVAPFDINLHDTYIVIGGRVSTYGQYSYLGYLCIVIVFFAYLLRCLYERFGTIIADFGLLIGAGFVLFFFENIVPMFRIHEPRRYYAYTEINSGISTGQVFKIALILIFAFTAFMIGRNWKKAI